MTESILKSLSALGDGPLTEDGLREHVFPLFSEVLKRDEIYLANHSLGRPLDETMRDVAAAVRLWQTRLDDAWEDWMAAQQGFRTRIAQLINAPRPDCVVPKTSAGQGLRAVLNSYDRPIEVLSTRGEFDSIDLILKQYAAKERIRLRMVEPDGNGHFRTDDLICALHQPTDLVVVSQVMFMTGQVLDDLPRLARAAHDAGARLLVDAYHAVGVLSVDVEAMEADFLIGGSYKYLRGGPGACYLYVDPQILDEGLTTLDTGWFAKRDPFAYQRPEPPEFAAGGDAWLESTPPVVAYYQARAGQMFTLGIGVDRLRAYSLDLLQRLRAYLAVEGASAQGGTPRHGAFLTVHHPQAMQLPAGLKALGINVDARGPWLRLCPDLLTTDEELQHAARSVAASVRG